MMIVLTNTSDASLTIILPHESVCGQGPCQCTERPGRPGRPGVRIPRSLLLPAGQVLGGLSDSVLRAPDLKRLLRSGAVTVQRVLPGVSEARRSPTFREGPVQVGPNSQTLAEGRPTLAEGPADPGSSTDPEDPENRPVPRKASAKNTRAKRGENS